MARFVHTRQSIKALEAASTHIVISVRTPGSEQVATP